MVKNKWAGLKGLLAASLLLGTGMVQAELIPYTSDGEALVFSTEQDLTWTADANLFKTQCDAEAVANCPNLIAAIIAVGSPVTHTGTKLFRSPHKVLPREFDQSNGQMTWFAAQAWVAYVNSIAYGGASDWRLFESDPGDTNCSDYQYQPGGLPLQYYGFGCTGNELGYLYYKEGGATPVNDLGPPISTLSPLSAVFTNLQDYSYWSGTEFEPNPFSAWVFGAYIGFQGTNAKIGRYMRHAWAVRPGQVPPP